MDSTGESAFARFDMLLNPDKPELSITPIRRSADIGDSSDLEIDQYLQSDPCSDCLKVSGIGMDEEGRVFMDVGIKHPFDESSQRLDLNAYDIRAIIIVQGDRIFPQTIINGQSVLGHFHFLANADGWTNHFDDGVNGQYPGNLNPFIEFFTEDDPTWDGIGDEIENHVMAVGADYDFKRLIFDIPSGEDYQFQLVVGASYGQSAKKSVTEGEPGSRTNPMYFLPEFNRKEAYSVVMIADELNFGANPEVVVDIEIKDWQAGAHVGQVYPEDLNDLTGPSGINIISLEIPELDYFSSEPDSTSGTGTWENPMHARFNVPVSSFSLYSCLTRVNDERIVEDMDMSTYQYAEIDTFIQMGENKSITDIALPQRNVVLGRRSVAVDDNRVYVTWADIQGYTGVILCSRSSDNGETFSPPVTVNDADHVDAKQRPSIAVSSTGRVYIVWEDYGNLNPFSDAPDILSASSNNQGYSFGSVVKVNDIETVADDFQTEPTVCTGNAGDVFVCWMEKPSGNSFKHIRVAHSVDSGLTFTEKKIVSEQLRVGNPTMDANSNGTIWVAWRDYRNENQDIFAVCSTNNGTSYGSEIRVNDDQTAEYQSAPSLVVDDDGVAYIAWEDSRQPGRSDFNIYFAHSTSSTSFSENQRINRIDNVAMNPNIAIAPNGGIFVVYRDMRSDVCGDIYVTGSLDKGQTFSVHHDVKVNDDDTPSIQITPQVAVGAYSKIHVIWGDGRGGNPSVFYANSIYP